MSHEKPFEFDRWGYGKPVTNRFNVDGSKPGGKAFIAAVEETKCTCGHNFAHHDWQGVYPACIDSECACKEFVAEGEARPCPGSHVR